METTWTVVELKRQPDNGLVFEATYVVNFKLEEQTSRHVGWVEFTGDANDPNFIPFDQLTESTVLTWIQEAITDFEKIEQEHLSILQQKIESLNNPTHLEGLPWDDNPGI